MKNLLFLPVIIFALLASNFAEAQRRRGEVIEATPTYYVENNAIEDAVKKVHARLHIENNLCSVTFKKECWYGMPLLLKTACDKLGCTEEYEIYEAGITWLLFVDYNQYGDVVLFEVQRYDEVLTFFFDVIKI